MPNRPKRPVSIVLISDSTGETARTAVNAAISQFPDVDPIITLIPFVRQPPDLNELQDIQIAQAQFCAYTVVDEALCAQIRARCLKENTPSIAILDPLINGIGALLGTAPSGQPGRQYKVDAGYFDRITALDFAIGHDDGLTKDHLLSADVVLTGVSRTSKTPTCIYLAYQGIKAANVPLIPETPEPPGLIEAITAGLPVIALTASASRLMHVRQTRLQTLGSIPGDNYSSRQSIEDELVIARLFFERHQLPVIDVTRRSIEETAAAVRHHLVKGTK